MRVSTTSRSSARPRPATWRQYVISTQWLRLLRLITCSSSNGVVGCPPRPMRWCTRFHCHFYVLANEIALPSSFSLNVFFYSKYSCLLKYQILHFSIIHFDLAGRTSCVVLGYKTACARKSWVSSFYRKARCHGEKTIRRNPNSSRIPSLILF